MPDPQPASDSPLAASTVASTVDQDIPIGEPAESESLQAIPDQAAFDNATALIEETYKVEFAQAKELSQRQALARRLIDVARQTKDNPAAVYALLQKASALAAESGHYLLAAEALDRVAETFAIDDHLARKEAALAKAAERAETPADYRLVAQRWSRLAEDAVRTDRHEDAVRMGEAAVAAVRGSRDEVYQSVLTKRLLDLRTIQGAYELVQIHKQSLEADRANADANFALGRFYCLYKDDWESGLPLLAKSTDSMLKELATRDLANPALPAEQSKLADAWWKLAENEPDPIPGRLLRVRAAH